MKPVFFRLNNAAASHNPAIVSGVFHFWPAIVRAFFCSEKST